MSIPRRYSTMRSYRIPNGLKPGKRIWTGTCFLVHDGHDGAFSIPHGDWFEIAKDMIAKKVESELASDAERLLANREAETNGAAPKQSIPVSMFAPYAEAIFKAPEENKALMPGMSIYFNLTQSPRIRVLSVQITESHREEQLFDKATLEAMNKLLRKVDWSKLDCGSVQAPSEPEV